MRNHHLFENSSGTWIYISTSGTLGSFYSTSFAISCLFNNSYSETCEMMPVVLTCASVRISDLSIFSSTCWASAYLWNTVIFPFYCICLWSRFQKKSLPSTIVRGLIICVFSWHFIVSSVSCLKMKSVIYSEFFKVYFYWDKVDL